MHPFELPVRGSAVLNLDLKQQGLGGDNSWGAWPHKEFQIPCEPMSYSFRLRPFAQADGTPMELSKTALP